MKVADLILLTRLELGMTWYALSKKSGVQIQQIQKIEDGGNYERDTANKLLRALKLDEI